MFTIETLVAVAKKLQEEKSLVQRIISLFLYSNGVQKEVTVVIKFYCIIPLAILHCFSKVLQPLMFCSSYKGH